MRIGGFLRLHRADLDRRGVGAQHLALAIGIGGRKKVSCISRADGPREVERGEIVIVGLDVRTFAIEKPMSAKIAVISSMISVIGWMRPRSAGEERTGRLTSTVSRARRSAIARSRNSPLRSEISACISSLSALIAAPRVWRSSGLMLPSVFRSSETHPFLPKAATRTASTAASSLAAEMSAMIVVFQFARSVIVSSKTCAS